MRFALSFFIFLFCFIVSSKMVLANSEYVLPYPSTMPGGVLYKIHAVSEYIQRYWYFGSFGKFSFNLKESDKYLVEAKTLFEYKQYLLGSRALSRSNSYFLKIKPSLSQAKNEGKNISEKLKLFNSAIEKHKEVLEQIRKDVPRDVLWSPEKDIPKKIMLHQEIAQAITLRTMLYE
jgi:hypothetical protein